MTKLKRNIPLHEIREHLHDKHNQSFAKIPINRKDAQRLHQELPKGIKQMEKEK